MALTEVQLLTIPQVAERMGKHKNTLYGWMKQSDFPVSLVYRISSRNYVGLAESDVEIIAKWKGVPMHDHAA